MRLAILFSILLFLSIRFFLRSPIASQSAVDGVFNMISHPNTSWIVMLNFMHVVPKNSFIFFKPNVWIRLAITWLTLSNFGFAWGFSVVARLVLIPYSFLVRSY